MKPEHEIFDDQLKSMLGGFEGSVSPDTWDAIAGAMDAPVKRRAAIYWYWLTGLVLLTVGAALYFFHWKDTNGPEGHGVVLEQHKTDAPILPRTSTDEPVDNQVKHSITAQQPSGAVRQPSGVVSTNPELPELPVLPGVDPGTDLGSHFAGNQGEQNVANELNTEVIHVRPHSTLAIFDASEIDAHELKYIPTINNGGRKDSKKILGMGTWEFGLSASPALASKLVKSNGSFGWLVNKDYKDITNRFESQGFSYQIAFQANRYITNRIYLSTGLIYNQMGENIEYDYLIDELPNVDYNFEKLDYITLNPQLWEHVQYNGHNTYHFIQIPVKLGIVVPMVHSRFSLRSELGMQYMRFLGGSGKKADETFLTLEDLSGSTEYAANSFGMSANFGIYRAFKYNLELGMVPFYQRNVTSIRRSDSPLDERPYNFGCNIQLTYKLNRGLR